MPMSTQSPQLNLDYVSCHRDAAWRARAIDAIACLARTGREFTAEDVIAIVGTPENFRVIGAVMNSAARAGSAITGSKWTIHLSRKGRRHDG